MSRSGNYVFDLFEQADQRGITFEELIEEIKNERVQKTSTGASKATADQNEKIWSQQVCRLSIF